MLDLIDTSPLTRRYWSMCVVVLLAGALDFFDFGLLGFVVAAVAKPWKLTFVEVAVVLLSGGVGAILGSFVWGWLGDRYGRKPMFIIGILTFSVGTFCLGFTPTGAWWYLTLFRFIVGFGLPCIPVVSVPLVLELTPTRYRTFLGAYAAAGVVSLGTLLASGLFFLLSPMIGWRGLFMLGLAPALLAVWVAFGVRESPRWLLGQGRTEEARRTIAWTTGTTLETVPSTAQTAPAGGVGSFAELYRLGPPFWVIVLSWMGATIAFYGVNSWGPTILTHLLTITAAAAAGIFVWISVAGLIGRLAFALLAQRIGRRPSLQIMGFGLAASMLLASLGHSVFIGTVSLFVVALIAEGFLGDGGFVNIAPYTPEIVPARLRAHAMGLGQAANGVGKVLGPVILAVIAGSGNFVTPAATVAAITPAFAVLAGSALMPAFAFTFYRREPHGRRLEEAGAQEATAVVKAAVD